VLTKTQKRDIINVSITKQIVSVSLCGMKGSVFYETKSKSVYSQRQSPLCPMHRNVCYGVYDRGRILGGIMIQIKICPYCSSTFSSDVNSRKYCTKKCAKLALKRRRGKSERCLCQWCGQVFTAKRKKKFCNFNCQNTYLRKLGILQMKVTKIPVKITINDVARESKKEGLTYGRYVSLKML